MSSQVSFSENPEFNEYLDSDTNNLVRIAGITFSSSDVLYRLDYDAYISALNDYKEVRESELKENIAYEYPTPIAYYFQQAEDGYDNNNHRLQLLRSTWEAIIFTLYAIVIGEVRSKSINLRSIGNSFSDYFSDRLGTKLLLIERILEYSTSNGITLNSQQIMSIDTIQKIRSLNQERNEFLHTAALSEDQAAVRFTELMPDVLDVLQNLKELEYVDIMRFTQTVNALNELKCEVFNGHSMTRKYKTVTVDITQLTTLSNELNTASVIVSYNSQIYNVSPFLHYRFEANGNATNLCYYKKEKPGSTYEFEVMSRAESFEIPRLNFDVRVNELRGLTI